MLEASRTPKAGFAAPSPKVGLRATKRKQSVPTSCKPNSDTHWSVQIGEKCPFSFGPESVRQSAPSGMVHSTVPCGPSSCGERSTWRKCAKWTKCRRFGWRIEVRRSGGQVFGRPPEQVSAHCNSKRASKSAIKGAKRAKRSWLALLAAGFPFFDCLGCDDLLG
jgi:hypothetical protein